MGLLYFYLLVVCLNLFLLLAVALVEFLCYSMQEVQEMRYGSCSIADKILKEVGKMILSLTFSLLHRVLL